MKIIKTEKLNNDNNFKKLKYIVPIVQSGVGLGLTCFLVSTGVINYENLINFDIIKDSFNNPMYNFLFNNFINPVELVEKIINTVGMTGIVLSLKSFGFGKKLSKPFIESDNFKKNPTVYKIKKIFKKQENKETDNKTSSKALRKLMKTGLGIAFKVFLICTNNINYNEIFNWDNLPHKLSSIAEVSKKLDFNIIKPLLSSLGATSLFFIERKDEKKEGIPLSINFKELITKKINKILKFFSLSDLKNVNEELVEEDEKEFDE